MDSGGKVLGRFIEKFLYKNKSNLLVKGYLIYIAFFLCQYCDPCIVVPLQQYKF